MWCWREKRFHGLWRCQGGPERDGLPLGGLRKRPVGVLAMTWNPFGKEKAVHHALDVLAKLIGWKAGAFTWIAV